MKAQLKTSQAGELQKKIRSRKAVIAVIGLGYVGLPLAYAFAQRGFKVYGIDIDPQRVNPLKKGFSYIDDIQSRELKLVIRSEKLIPTVSFDVLKHADAVIVCVPTPLNRVKSPDISYIVAASEKIAHFLHPGQLISLESTTYPGTTEEVILPALEKTGLKTGKDFFLVFSPERVDPGNGKFKTQNIPKVVGGTSPVCGKLGAFLYQQIITEVITVSSPRTAEMTKLLENTFRIVNIGLINELAVAASNLKIDIWEAIDAAKTKPFGYMPFYPGPGIGGHCIGIDPLYLSWKAKIHGSDLHFIELARRINAEMPGHVVSQALYALNRYRGKAVSRSRILVLGVAYKKNVSDLRESPALDIMEKLIHLGAKVAYHDPFIPRVTHEGISLNSLPLTAAVLKKQDIVIIATDHSCFNYDLVAKQARLIFDTRNVLKKFSSPKIVRL